jgi:hypothetical protein
MILIIMAMNLFWEFACVDGEFREVDGQRLTAHGKHCRKR